MPAAALSAGRSAAGRPPRRPPRLPIVGLPLIGLPLAVALLAPALSGSRLLLGGDVLLFVLPQLALLRRALAGRLLAPGWEPALGLGAPLTGDLSLLAHDPWSALALALDPPLALAWGLALRLALACAGAVLLARSLRASPQAAALTGLVYALGGVACAQVDVPPYAAGLAALPWTAFALRAAAARPTALRCLLAGVPPALAALASALEPAGLGLLLGAGLALPFGARRAAAVTLAAGLACCALAAPGLVPLLGVLEQTERAQGYPWEVATRWSLHPAELPGLLVPRLAGPGGLSASALGMLERPWYGSLYLGAIPLALAGLGLARGLAGPGSGAGDRDPRRHARRHARRLLLLALPCLLWALGRFGPLLPVLYPVLPPLHGLRYPAKAFLGVWLALALLAGLGLDSTRGPGGPARLARALLAVAGAALLVGASAAAAGLSGAGLRALQPLGVALVAWALARGRPAGARRGLLLLALCDLLLAGRAGLELVPPGVWRDPPALLGAALEAQAEASWPLRVGLTDRARRATPAADGARLTAQRERRDGLHPNTGAADGLRAVDAFTSLDPLRQALLRAARARGALDERGWLRLNGAALVVCAPREAGYEDAWTLDRVQPGGRRLAALPDALPWAAVYARAERASDPRAALDRLLSPGFQPERDLIVEAPPDRPLPHTRPPSPLSPDEASSGAARLLTAGPDQLVLDCRAPSGGWLLVREGWAPGWRARVDDAPAPVLPGDLLFRAVPLPAGARRVTLEYHAPGRDAGLLLGGLAWGALVALGLRALRRG